MISTLIRGYGGLRLYRQMRPAFIGLILGEYLTSRGAGGAFRRVGHPFRRLLQKLVKGHLSMSTEIRALRKDELTEHGELVYISYSHGRRLDPESGVDRTLLPARLVD